MRLDRVISALKNEWIAVIVAALILFIVAMASFQLWTFFVSILIVGVVADFVAGLFTAGGKRAPRIPMSGSSHIQSSGFVYLAFFIGVIAAALLSSYILGGILGNLVASDLGGQFLLGSGAALLVWFDMRRRLYRR